MAQFKKQNLQKSYECSANQKGINLNAMSFD